MLERVWRKGNPLTLLVGMQTSTATMENSVEIPLKKKKNLEIKAKINKWDLIKIKSFCTTMETISKVIRQPSEWEKIIANEATDKELISKIYRQHLQLNSGKINNPIKNGPKN